MNSKILKPKGENCLQSQMAKKKKKVCQEFRGSVRREHHMMELQWLASDWFRESYKHAKKARGLGPGPQRKLLHLGVFRLRSSPRLFYSEIVM